MDLKEWTTIIDWDFVKRLEKSRVLKGYVPKRKDGTVIGNSGVTIATGVDLGSKDAYFLTHVLELPMYLVRHLYNYLGRKKEDAVKALELYPLHITESEAIVLDTAMGIYTLKELAKDWRKHTHTSFTELPKEVRTVLFSLGYNFGVPLSKSLPHTFKTVMEASKQKDWRVFRRHLENFPSKNPELVNRRKEEAAYLKSLFIDSTPDTGAVS